MQWQAGITAEQEMTKKIKSLKGQRKSLCLPPLEWQTSHQLKDTTSSQNLFHWQSSKAWMQKENQPMLSRGSKIFSVYSKNGILYEVDVVFFLH